LRQAAFGVTGAGMRVVFMGTPEFAVPALEALAARHDVACVYTQPPRPAHRGKRLAPSPVQLAAQRLGLAVRSPVNFKDEADRAALAALGADVAVVAAYGLILPQAVLDAPARGCINIHASLLPRWRGAAPIQRAILAGDHETGITIMQMERGLDTGPMVLKRATDIGRKTAGELTVELAAMGAALIVEALDQLDALVPEPQPEDGVTYASKIDKAEARIDLDGDPVLLNRVVRAFNPAPGAWTEIGGERVKILAGDVDGGRYHPALVQPAGRPAMAWDAFERGRRG
jgi:methionyl-tRNA formyltransferase